MKNTIVKALIFFNHASNPQLLVLTRVATAKVYPGMEDLPGGKVDQDEPLLQAITREVHEETQLAVTNFQYLVTQEYITMHGVHNTEHIFVGLSNTDQVTLNPAEHTGYRWLTLDQINQTTLHPAVIKIILTHEKQIKKYLEKR